MVSKTPPAEMMRPADLEKLEQMQTVEEDEQPADGEMRRTDNNRYRYTEQHIYGIEGKVRFRSLTAREFIAIQRAPDEVLLLHSVVRPDGEQAFTEETLQMAIDEWDAETYLEMLRVADQHCFNKRKLAALVEDQSGN